METHEKNNLSQKVELTNFYKKNFETWKDGEILEFNPQSKQIAENNSLNEFIKLLQDYTGNSLQLIYEEFGFLENEVILYANTNKLILTNKRYFILNGKKKVSKFDSYFLNKIKKVKKNGLFNLTIVTNDGIKIEYMYSGDWIKMEGVQKAMKILPSENDFIISNEFYKENKTVKNKAIEKYSNRKTSFFNAGFLIGGIGLPLLVTFFLPKGYAITNKWLIAIIFIVGAVVGSSVFNYIANRINNDDE